MLGGVLPQRGNDTLRGGRLVIDLHTGISSFDDPSRGGAGGAVRDTHASVSGYLSVPKR